MFRHNSGWMYGIQTHQISYLKCCKRYDYTRMKLNWSMGLKSEVLQVALLGLLVPFPFIVNWYWTHIRLSNVELCITTHNWSHKPKDNAKQQTEEGSYIPYRWGTNNPQISTAGVEWKGWQKEPGRICRIWGNPSDSTVESGSIWARGCFKG